MESDEDVMEITQEALQNWIRKEVKKSKMVDLSAEQRCQLLLEKRDKQRAGLVKLTQSVADCEVVIQQLYSLLGWDYRDEDSEDEEELQRKLPAMGSNSMGETSASRNDADGDPECGKEMGIPPISLPQRDGGRGRTYSSHQPISSSPRRRPVVVLKRLPAHEIHSALCPQSPTLHDIGGCSDDVHNDDDYKNGVGDVDENTDDDDVIDKERGLATGCDYDSSSEDSWNGMATVCTRKTKTLSQISAKDNKAKIKSKSVTAERQNGEQSDAPHNGMATVHHDAPMSAEPQSCGIAVSSISQSCTPITSPNPPTLPEQKIELNMKVLARRKTRKWLPGKIVEIIPKERGEGFKYKVSLENSGRILVSGHHLAFENTPPLLRLYVGARVVTRYRKDKPFFYSGILGELPSRRNRMRFLVFFDDHTPTYVGLPFLHLVCRPLVDPWADISEDAHQRFIKEYLKVWPYPPIAHYFVDQKLNVDCEGVQRACEVLHIDCSLMRVLFKHSGHKEWIYRGSMRLEHMVNMNKVLQKMDRAGETKAAKPSLENLQEACSRSCSTATTPPAAMVNYTPHLCSPACLEQVRPDRPLEALRKRNPLLVPMMYKFRRVKKQLSPYTTTTCVPVETKPSYSIYYYAPCGLPLSTIAQVEEYLHDTRCDFLSMDAFSLDPHVSVAGAKPLPFKVFIPDLAGGGENKAVPCINEHNNQLPPKLSYRSGRDTSHVSLEPSPDFVTGCNCIDGCRDRCSCSCRQLTIQSTGGRPLDENSGYTQKRLNHAVVTGVYECNAQCLCDPRTCSNRVAQHGIQVRLQVFMTRDRGWGVRCLDDIPGGTFVCSYSGRVVPGNENNRISNAHYVELNHIEGVELHKEGYETEAYCSETASKPTKAKDPLKRTKPASPMVPMTTSRRFFDGEGHGYILDANMEGNVARFLNHSCSPNMFKQYVFVDTHDLRFPWLTFFTSKSVKAGTELTWDYRPIKEDDAETLLGQACRCGSKNCCGQL
ncbi:unnamed protein product [Lota lota]